MRCDRCGKDGADIYFVKILDGHSVEEHLCKDCMRDVLPVDDVSSMFKVSFSLDGIKHMQDAIKDLLMPALPGLSEEEEFPIICPHCGKEITFDDVTGLSFDGTKEELSEEEKLKQEMARVVKEENYERAAVIRDMLKELYKKKEEENRI